MRFITGFLLNVFIVFNEPLNRHERRSKAKTGFVVR